MEIAISSLDTQQSNELGTWASYQASIIVFIYNIFMLQSLRTFRILYGNGGHEVCFMIRNDLNLGSLKV